MGGLNTHNYYSYLASINKFEKSTATKYGVKKENIKHIDMFVNRTMLVHDVQHTKLKYN